MSVTRQGNWLSQLRVDVPDLRAIESSLANDFDVLAGKILSGKSPLVIRGFTISTTSALGNRADLLQLSTAAGLLMHFGASEAGTIFSVPDTQAVETLSATNTKIVGSFTAGTTNYIGLDLRRSADSTTSDSSKFLDANTLKEISKTIPKARTLDYRIIISTQPFSVFANVAPIAKVVTDSSNNVVSITDARSMMFRLGSGSDVPNPSHAYTWQDSDRIENNTTFSSSSSADPFSGGDKQVLSLKEWMDAVMTRLWELGSGRYWYSPTSRENTKLLNGQPLLGNGDNWDWNLGSQTLSWDGLSVAFENGFADDGTGVFKNTITAGSAVILDGQCLYVDLQRGTVAASLIPAVANLTALIGPNSPVIPGSRFIIAWRIGTLVFTRDRPYEVGRSLQVASTTTLGVVKLFQTPGTPLTPVVLNLNSNGSITWVASGGNANGLTVTGNGGTVGTTTSVIQSCGVFGIGAGIGAGLVGIGGGDGSAPGPGVYGEASDGTNGRGGWFVGKGTGFGLFSQGGPNPSIAGGPTFGISPVPGPGGVGGVFFGGGGTQGGDGIQAYALSTSNPKAGGVFAGSWPGVDAAQPGVGAEMHGGTAFSNQNGGRGIVSFGGQASGAGKAGGFGGDFTGGAGVSGANGGIGVVTIGGTNAVGLLANGNGTGEAIIAFGGSNSSAISATSGAAGQSAIVGIGVSGGQGAYFRSSVANVDVLKVDGYINVGGATNPSNSTPFTNKITPANVCKAWLTFTLDGASPPNVSILDGFNATASGNTGPTSCTITFPQPMANASYAIDIQGGINVLDGSNNIYGFSIQSRAAGSFTFRPFLQGTGGTTFPGGTYSIIVFGKQ